MTYIVLVALFYLLVSLLSALQCSYMCECSGFQCFKCYSDFTSNANFKVNPLAQCGCPSGYFTDNNGTFCKFCPIECMDCSDEGNCATCERGYMLMGGKCIEEKTEDSRIQLVRDFSSQKYEKKDWSGFWIQGAVATNNIGNYFNNYLCQQLGQNVFGHYYFGWNTYLVRTYQSLPPHQFIQLKIQFVIIDQWVEQTFMVEVQTAANPDIHNISSNAYSTAFTFNESQKRGYNFCGSQHNDNLGLFNKSYPHTNSILKVRIRPQISFSSSASLRRQQQNIYYGIKEMVLIIGNCPKGCKICDAEYCADDCLPNYAYNYIKYTCECDTAIAILTLSGQCIPKCLSGSIYAPLQGACLKCQQIFEGCLTCQIDSCNICQIGFFYINGKCVKNCPVGFKQSVENAVNLCIQCLQGCLRCGAYTCYECKQNFALFNGQCVAVCPEATYFSQENKRCQFCPQNCLSCQSPRNCTSCSQDNITQYALIQGRCVEKCSSTSVAVTKAKCKDKCHTNCIQCFGTQINQCLRCKHPYKYLKHQCLDYCPHGYFQLEGKCEKCQLQCKECTRLSCISCMPTYYLHKQKCLYQCPVGYFQDAINNTCQKCLQNCTQCFDELVCKTCSGGYFLNNGSCLKAKNCSNEFYYNEILAKCLPCPEFCLTCNEDLCQTCQVGTFLDNGECVQSCPFTKFTDFTTSRCLWKSPLCEVYDQQNQTCLKCIFNNPALVFSLDGKQCLSACPEGFTSQQTQMYNRTSCSKQCPPLCSICDANQICYKCQNGSLYYRQTSTCVIQCPEGYRSDSKQCISCSTGCKKCQQNGACLECFTLYDSRILNLNQRGQCIEQGCISSFKDNSGVCVECPDPCQTCSNSSYECTSCKQMYLFESSCVQLCPPSYYPDNQTMQCLPFEPGCLWCQSANKCLDCYEQLMLFEGRCIERCPHGYFITRDNENIYNTNAKKCKKCHKNCLKCYGETKFQCLECLPHYSLQGQECVKDCPKRKYVGHEGHCEPCFSACQTCHGPGRSQCITCRDNFQFSLGMCIPQCPSSKFYNSKIQKCEDCSRGCLLCNDTTTCIQCSDRYSLQNGKCISFCPSTKYSHNKICQQCSVLNCLQCSNNKCQKCEDLYFLHDGNCVQECPDATYKAQHHHLRKCLECPHRCLECEGPRQCTKCASNFHLSHGVCKNKCQKGHYFNTTHSQCKACSHSHTETCGYDDKISKCEEGYFRLQSQCLSSCPDKFYSSKQSQSCEPCHSTCKKCNEKRTHCLACEEGFWLKHHQCLKQAEPDSCGEGCAKCADENTCSVCMTPYYLTGDHKCSKECQVGKYKHLRECISCEAKCQVCSNSQQCEVCKQGYVLLGNSCVDECPPGYFQQSQDYSNTIVKAQCQKCSSNCLTCTMSSECMLCNIPYLMYQDYCIIKCPQSFYPLDGFCYQCKENCISCNTPQICDVCSKDTIIYNGTCYETVITECPPGTYLKEFNSCINCEAPCETCIDILHCSSCVSGYALYESTCLQKCPQSYFINNMTSMLICQPCLHQCLTCIQFSSKCTSCVTGLYLAGQRCSQTCPISTFPDSLNKICRKCPPFCLSCKNSQSCLHCHSSTYLLFGRCVQLCPEGYTGLQMQDASFQLASVCEKCIYPCQTCIEPTVYGCQSCEAGFFLKGSLCLMKCPAGYYEDSQRGLCRLCAPECQTCTDFQACTVCAFGSDPETGLCNPVNTICLEVECECDAECELCYQGVCFKCYGNYLLANDQCVQECPQAYIPDKIQQKCVFSSIDYCLAGNSGDQCTLCSDGYVLYQGSCYSACPIFTQISENSTVCELDPCILKEEQQCLTCMSPYYTLNGQCVLDCLNNYYEEGTSCVPCPSSCLSCVTYKKCLSCLQGFIAHQGACVSKCPLGFFNDISECKSCGAECLRCASSVQCLECRTGKYLYEDECLQLCPIGTFKDDSSRSCVECSQSCLECSSLTHCTICSIGLYLMDFSCVDNCETGYYQSNVSTTLEGFPIILGYCQICPNNCYNCTADQCFSCKSDMYLYNSKCISACPANTFKSFDSVIQQCIQCTSPCYNCFSSSQCISCIPGYFLFQNTCLQSCPIQYFSSGNQCQKCKSTCEQCSSLFNCTKCQTGLLLIDGQCLSDCSLITQYYDSLNFICRSCSSECLQCYGGRYDECLSCRNPLILHDSTCLVECPNKLYFSSQFQKCEECPSDCLSCGEKIGIECYQCMDNLFLLNGSCIEDCPDLYYENINEKLCQLCSDAIPGCLSCVYQNLIMCTTCQNSQILSIQGLCLNFSDCPLYQMVIINGVCQYCSANCKQCVTDEDMNEECIGCMDGYVLREGRCQLQCPASYIAQYVNNVANNSVLSCSKCGDNCLECQISKSSQIICTKCSQPFYLFNQFQLLCVAECPLGYFALETPVPRCLLGDLNSYLIQQCQINNYLAIADTFECVQSCPIGYFYSTNQLSQNLCMKCRLGCKQCISSSICLQCEPGLSLFNNKECLDQCPITHLSIENVCLQCQSPCQTCLGDLFTCTKCSSNLTLISGQCVSSCPSGLYYFEGVCIKCSSQCETCSSSSVCVTCKNKFYLAPSCTDIDFNCPLNYYQKSSRPTACDGCSAHCGKCHKSCEQCYGPNKFECLSCSGGTVLVDGQCREGCPIGYLITALTLPVECIKCSDKIRECQQCKESGQNIFECLQCSDQFILFEKKCLQSCSDLDTPTKKYSFVNNTCVACIQNCLQCVTGSCIKCISPYFMEYQKEGPNICVEFCSLGYYLINITISNPECYACRTQCQTCIQYNKCLTCAQGYYLFSDQCISACPQQTYLNSVSQSCIQCSRALSKRCLNCSISEDNIVQCLSCIHPYSADENGKCKSCLNGYFYSSSTQTCNSCPSQCTTCASLDQCLECSTGFVLWNQQCLISCPAQTYKNNQSCVPCANIFCNKCDSSICYQCLKGYGLYEGQCVQQCPVTTLMVSSICQSCENGCQICSNLQSCQKCSALYKLFMGDCLSSCPKGFASDENSTCVPCGQGCKQCSQINLCDACQTELTHNGDGTCSYQKPNDCQTGFYSDEGQCKQCHQSCLQCSGPRPNKCLSCIQGYSLLKSGYCVSICQPHEFFNPNISLCEACSPNCATCINDSQFCLSCPDSKTLSENACIDSCGPGTFISNMVCAHCPQFCLTCTSATKCSSCHPNATFFYNSFCYAECPMFAYQDGLSTCAPCPSGCITCTSNVSCQSCEFPLSLFMDPESGQGQCIEVCPLAMYSLQNVCVSCPDNCQQCNQTSCIQCMDEKYFYEDSCLSNCPVRFYPTANQTCQACEFPCDECTSDRKCLSCLNDTLLFIISAEQSQCVNICPQNYIKQGKKCVQIQCANCSVCINAKCQLCIEGFFLFDSQCLESCPTQMYENQIDFTCSKCIQNCVECVNGTNCDVCIQGFNFTEETGCVEEAYLEFGGLSNMSGYTANITEVSSTVYLATSVGPMVFGEISNTYFNIEFCQFFFFHDKMSKSNKEISKFLQSLGQMSLTSGIQTASGRRLLTETDTLSFLEVNLPIFIMIGAFLGAFILVAIIKNSIQCCCGSCPSLSFYMKEISNYLQKRFKWIYFDFVVWVSYLPFVFFALAQTEKINFDNVMDGISSVLSIAILATYPFYPIFICYQIKKHYQLICKKDPIVLMSLGPWISQIKEPEQIPEDQKFQYFTFTNFRLIYYALKYFRKFLFIIIIAFNQEPITTLYILIALNILFVLYMIIVRPRKIPYMIFDFIIEGILLGFQIFLLVYLYEEIDTVNAISIITHIIGFITANLSIIIAIIFNLIAYYQIFVCFRDLIRYLNKQKEQNVNDELKDEKASNMNSSTLKLVENGEDSQEGNKVANNRMFEEVEVAKHLDYKKGLNKKFEGKQFFSKIFKNREQEEYEIDENEQQVYFQSNIERAIPKARIKAQRKPKHNDLIVTGQEEFPQNQVIEEQAL